ncbi:type VI secretion system ImpA family N-terminal domain-containing protein [Diaphorobacter sp.]|uniref:type VI secretion system ImpA family N-terminal domain-containing protein n=1 Tax=Diaphorobacter sp. TaxID=1934310 RepID=UPI0039185F3A
MHQHRFFTHQIGVGGGGRDRRILLGEDVRCPRQRVRDDIASRHRGDLPPGADLGNDAVLHELGVLRASGHRHRSLRAHRYTLARTHDHWLGDTVIAGKERDWQQTLMLASELSEKTYDLRILLLLTRALTRLHGLKGALYGITSIYTIFDNFWESLHPQLVIDEEFDPRSDLVL